MNYAFAVGGGNVQQVAQAAAVDTTKAGHILGLPRRDTHLVRERELDALQVAITR